jgi:hypothetical protein
MESQRACFLSDEFLVHLRYQTKARISSTIVISQSVESLREVFFSGMPEKMLPSAIFVKSLTIEGNRTPGALSFGLVAPGGHRS